MMKIAFYVEDGLEQLVLTPQTDSERNLLAKIHEDRELQIFRGSFYDCRGGWTRQGAGEESTIIKMWPKSKTDRNSDDVDPPSGPVWMPGARSSAVPFFVA